MYDVLISGRRRKIPGWDWAGPINRGPMQPHGRFGCRSREAGVDGPWRVVGRRPGRHQFAVDASTSWSVEEVAINRALCYVCSSRGGHAGRYLCTLIYRAVRVYYRFLWYRIWVKDSPHRQSCANKSCLPSQTGPDVVSGRELDVSAGTHIQPVGAKSGCCIRIAKT